jgi:hypothetical protein
MSNRAAWQVNTAYSVDDGALVVSPGARARFYENNTATPITVYSDAAATVVISQPIDADENGVFQPLYLATNAAYRLVVTDADDAPLDGFPMDDLVPLGDVSSAASVSFSPTETLPVTNTQAAIEAAAALFSDQTATIARSFTAWATGGSDNAYTITPDPAITGYGDHQAFLVQFDRANSGVATLNVNGLGARDIYRSTTSGVPTPMLANEIRPGDRVMLIFDGARFVAGLNDYRPLVGAGYIRHPNGIQECWATVSGSTSRTPRTSKSPSPFSRKRSAGFRPTRITSLRRVRTASHSSTLPRLATAGARSRASTVRLAWWSLTTRTWGPPPPPTPTRSMHRSQARPIPGLWCSPGRRTAG